MNKIKQVKDKKEIAQFNSIKEASASINTKMDNWKVQMLIANAINTGKRAFGCNWIKVS